MTHSAYIADPDGYGLEIVYDVPAEVWEGDVDAALNYFEFLPPDERSTTAPTTNASATTSRRRSRCPAGSWPAGPRPR